MNRRRLELLLVAWVVLVIVPGVMAASGANVDDDVGGAVVGWWIGGYLAQFAIFMWIMRIINKQTFLPWLVASTLPWAVDWTLPGSRLFVLPWTAFAIGVAWWIYRSADHEEELREHGVPAEGVVLEVIRPKLFNTVVNNVYIKRKLRLRIERQDGVAPYEAIYKGLFMLGEIPGTGDRMSLRVDPKNPHHFVDADNGSGGGAAPADSYDSSPFPDSPPINEGPDGDDLTSQLEKLSALHKSGSLTDAEFATAKERLLGSR